MKNRFLRTAASAVLTVLLVLIGALIIGILDNGLNLMGVNSDWQFIIKGVVILGAVYMDFLRSRKRAKG